MKKVLSIVLAVMMIVSVSCITVSANSTPEVGMIVDYSIQSNHMFVEQYQINLSYTGEALKMTATGADPYFKLNNAGDNWNSYYAPGTGIDLDTYRYVAFCYKSNASATNAMLFSDSTATDNFGNAGTYINYTLENSSSYTIKVLDMKALNPTGWTGKLEGIRFDPAEAQFTGSVEMKWFGLFRTESYARSYDPATKHNVSTNKDTYIVGESITVTQAHTGAGDWVAIVPTGLTLTGATESQAFHQVAAHRSYFYYANTITINTSTLAAGTYDVVSLLGDNFIEIDRKTITFINGVVEMSAGSASGNAGDTIKVPINVNNAGGLGIYAVNLSATYNSSVLTLTGLENGTVFTAMDTYSSQATAEGEKVNFLVVSDDGANSSKSGVLVYLVFQINPALATDSTVTIALSTAGLGADCINYNAEDVSYSITGSGTVTAAKATGPSELTLTDGTTSYFTTSNGVKILAVMPVKGASYASIKRAGILDSVNEDEFVKIYNAAGAEVTSVTTNIATGFTISLVDASGNAIDGQTYVIAVIGDFDKNGRVNAADYSSLRSLVIQKPAGYTITAFLAADANYIPAQFVAANYSKGVRLNASSYATVRNFVDTGSWG